MWLENSEIISHQNREAAIGLVDMHMKKYSRVSASAFVRNTETELLIVREALTVRPEYRSRSSTAKIVEMLRLGCKLSPLLINCSDFDLLSIANSAVLEDIELSDFQSTLIVNRGDPILSIYIILQGVLEVAVVDEAPPAANGVSQGEKQPFDESAVKIDPPVASLEASTLRKRYLKIGDCIGEALMEGQVSWAADVSAVHTKRSRGRREVLSLCSLPAASVLKHLGRKGRSVRY
jgi:CRP-like cAMP-binding protein